LLQEYFNGVVRVELVVGGVRQRFGVDGFLRVELVAGFPGQTRFPAPVAEPPEKGAFASRMGVAVRAVFDIFGRIAGQYAKVREMRVVIQADGTTPLTVVLEPSGMEYVVEPGDHLVYEWSVLSSTSTLLGSIGHEPSTITIGEASGPSRLWNSRGEELSIIGGPLTQ
jgi:hypothetical protein